MSIDIKIKKINEFAKIPTQGSKYSAGYDLYSCIDEYIEPHSTRKINTGLSVELPHGYFGAIFARSGLATKEGLRPSNCVGICDEDYRGEYIVALYNDSDEIRSIKTGDRIAQLIILPYQMVNFIIDDYLSETERGINGFGSTNK